MLLKEYRICMPLTVEEYKIGQLYMISKHSLEQSGGGEGVEVVRNEPDTHPQYGPGQVTEKRIYLNSKLPSWMRKFVPMIFYVTEKAWNFYPYTITEYSCSFLPRLQVKIETRFENDDGSSEDVFGDGPTPQDSVCFLDILSDPIPEKHYRKTEDLSGWVSKRTGRGPLVDGWRNSTKPIMCSYKKVQCSFEVYGFQGRTEEFIHKNIRDILLVGHRQAVAWADEWHGMSLEDVREFEKKLQLETNSKLKADMTDSAITVRSAASRHFEPMMKTIMLSSGNKQQSDSAPSGGTVPLLHPQTAHTDAKPSSLRPSFSRSVSVTDESSLKKMGLKTVSIPDSPSRPSYSLKSPMRLNSNPE